MFLWGIADAERSTARIPEGTKIIGEKAYLRSENLQKVYMPDTLKIVDASAFASCTALENVYFGEILTEIGSSAFAGCTKLDNVQLPESLSTIGDAAFSGCTSLESIAVPKLVTLLPENVFSGCSGLGEVEIGAGVRKISGGAFAGCVSLQDITVPENVLEISDGAFSGCSGLTAITLPFVGNMRKSSSDNNQLPFGCIFGEMEYEGGAKIRQQYLQSLPSVIAYADYYIPEKLASVTITGGEILAYAFYNCNMLQNIVLGDAIKKVGMDAFYYCENLQSVKFGAQTEAIGTFAFDHCTALQQVSLPEKLTEISDGTFDSCANLKTVYIPASVKSVGQWAFNECNSFSDVYFGGTESQWKAMTIGKYNDPLKNANLHYGKIPTGKATIEVKTTASEMTVVIGSNGETIENVSVMVGSYDGNGRLIGLRIEKCPVLSGKVSFTFPRNPEAAEEKIFALNSGMQALSGAFSVKDS